MALFTLLVLLMHFGPSHGLDYCPQDISRQEAETLRQVAKEVGKPEWNCPDVPCKTNNCWDSMTDKSIGYTVECDCIDGTSHVTVISWIGQNLSGILPPSLAKLPYIKHVDLSRNLLTGTIPKEWTSTKLEYISLFANRLSGPIPLYLGDITTLTYLSIESNSFNGSVPAELGKLVNLTQINLSDNNLSGKLPVELKNLSKLTVLQLISNNFSGSLPDIFRNMTQLKRLMIQGSGFKGEIPSSISQLTSMTELRISDLNTEGSTFPDLRSLTKLIKLVLRGCNINGPIPTYLSGMSLLNHLDLSFNNLTGPITSQLNDSLNHLQYLYLTGNMLSGAIPNWTTTKYDNSYIDLSYNNFDEISDPVLCTKGTLNLYRSNARKRDLDSSACLRTSKCPRARYSLHINCGGKKTTIGKTTYEQDDDIDGAANFFHLQPEWGYSSSGEFGQPTKTYIARNNFVLSMNDTEAPLYREARLSATSLTYYGRCLAKGNYIVTLYFSEIVFADNHTYLSLGRRMFDIYIQENLMQENFNIEKEANGINKPFAKVFRNIPVTNSIEIRLHYAGKGSTHLPITGNFGPLISAISIKSEFSPPFNWKIVLWVSIGVMVGVLGIAFGRFWWKRRLAEIASREQDLLRVNPQVGLFTYRQIKTACNNFDATNKIGEGGFGSVYKGTLSDGTCIAVKLLSSRSSQGNREFLNEIGIITSLHHPNLVRLYGCCVERTQLILVYEYLENGDLGHALLGPENSQLMLDWPARKRICLGIARGMTFLHEESAIKIVHRDIKATNVLLDRELNPKIADFGLARLNEEEYTHISTRVAGTIGYMAPEYALWGHLTHKADVYSFGVVAVEIVAGRSNMSFQPSEDLFCLLDWASVLKQKGNLTELVDSSLGDNYNKEEATTMIKVALLCTNASAALRPTMSEALSMLEGNMVVRELNEEANTSHGHEWMYQLSKHPNEVFETETQSLIHSSDVPMDECSKSLHDLYPVGTYSGSSSSV